MEGKNRLFNSADDHPVYDGDTVYIIQFEKDGRQKRVNGTIRAKTENLLRSPFATKSRITERIYLKLESGTLSITPMSYSVIYKNPKTLDLLAMQEEMKILERKYSDAEAKVKDAEKTKKLSYEKMTKLQDKIEILTKELEYEKSTL